MTGAACHWGKSCRRHQLLRLRQRVQWQRLHLGAARRLRLRLRLRQRRLDLGTEEDP